MDLINLDFNESFIWITLINHGYINYCKNFLKSMELTKCNFKLIVYCIDIEDIEELKKFKNCISLDASVFLKFKMSSDLKGWLDKEYIRITFAKLDAILYTLKTTYDKGITEVGYIDTDIILFSDPTVVILEAIQKYKDTNLFFQCDENTDFCSNKLKCDNICSGVAVYKNLKEMYHIFEYEENDLNIFVAGDQSYLLYKIKKYNIPYVTIEKDIFINGSYEGGLGNRICKKFPEKACLVHFNYIVGSGKENVMKLYNVWYD